MADMISGVYFISYLFFNKDEARQIQGLPRRLRARMTVTQSHTVSMEKRYVHRAHCEQSCLIMVSIAITCMLAS